MKRLLDMTLMPKHFDPNIICFSTTISPMHKHFDVLWVHSLVNRKFRMTQWIMKMHYITMQYDYLKETLLFFHHSSTVYFIMLVQYVPSLFVAVIIVLNSHNNHTSFKKQWTKLQRKFMFIWNDYFFSNSVPHSAHSRRTEPTRDIIYELITRTRPDQT